LRPETRYDESLKPSKNKRKQAALQARASPEFIHRIGSHASEMRAPPPSLHAQ